MTKNDSSLYRHEALAAKKGSDYGKVLLLNPLSLKVAALLAVCFIVLIIIFLLFGEFTQKATLAGQLMPVNGVVKIYPPYPAKVIQRQVHEGDPVDKGTLLYILSSAKFSKKGDTDVLISQELQKHIDQLSLDIAEVKQQQPIYLNNIQQQLQAITDSSVALQQREQRQQQKIKVAQESFSRYRQLSSSGAVSKEMLDQQNSKLLEEQGVLDAIHLEKQTLERQRLALLTDQLEHNSTYNSRLSQLQQSLVMARNELTHSEMAQELYIYSPVKGTASIVLTEPGQYVDPSHPMVSIVAQGEPLVAILYATSNSIGFIKPGSEVLLRYKAYPYEKFGQYKGKVQQVAVTASSAGELMGMHMPPELQSEPLYRLTVILEQQYVLAYGKQTPLVAGMQVEADISLDTRKLYEWVLEPVFSITGRY